jgi:hypothetical protein
MHNQAVAGRKVNIDPIVELDPKYHYETKVEKSDKVGKLTPKEKEVKLTSHCLIVSSLNYPCLDFRFDNL